MSKLDGLKAVVGSHIDDVAKSTRTGLDSALGGTHSEAFLEAIKKGAHEDWIAKAKSGAHGLSDDAKKFLDTDEFKALAKQQIGKKVLEDGLKNVADGDFKALKKLVGDTDILDDAAKKVITGKVVELQFGTSLVNELEHLAKFSPNMDAAARQNLAMANARKMADHNISPADIEAKAHELWKKRGAPNDLGAGATHDHQQALGSLVASSKRAAAKAEKEAAGEAVEKVAKEAVPTAPAPTAPVARSTADDATKAATKADDAAETVTKTAEPVKDATPVAGGADDAAKMATKADDAVETGTKEATPTAPAPTTPAPAKPGIMERAKDVVWDDRGTLARTGVVAGGLLATAYVLWPNGKQTPLKTDKYNIGLEENLFIHPTRVPVDDLKEVFEGAAKVRADKALELAKAFGNVFGKPEDQSIEKISGMIRSERFKSDFDGANDTDKATLKRIIELTEDYSRIKGLIVSPISGTPSVIDSYVRERKKEIDTGTESKLAKDQKKTIEGIIDDVNKGNTAASVPAFAAFFDRVKEQTDPKNGGPKPKEAAKPTEADKAAAADAARLALLNKELEDAQKAQPDLVGPPSPEMLAKIAERDALQKAMDDRKAVQDAQLAQAKQNADHAEAMKIQQARLAEANKPPEYKGGVGTLLAEGAKSYVDYTRVDANDRASKWIDKTMQATSTTAGDLWGFAKGSFNKMSKDSMGQSVFGIGGGLLGGFIAYRAVSGFLSEKIPFVGGIVGPLVGVLAGVAAFLGGRKLVHSILDKFVNQGSGSNLPANPPGTPPGQNQAVPSQSHAGGAPQATLVVKEDWNRNKKGDDRIEWTKDVNGAWGAQLYGDDGKPAAPRFVSYRLLKPEAVQSLTTDGRLFGGRPIHFSVASGGATAESLGLNQDPVGAEALAHDGTGADTMVLAIQGKHVAITMDRTTRQALGGTNN